MILHINREYQVGKYDRFRGKYPNTDHLQRCDRILWKSTVHPPLEEEQLTGDMSSRSKSSFAQRLAKVLRPRSWSSPQNPMPPMLNTDKEAATPTLAAVQTPQSIPFSGIVQPPGSTTLNHSRSHESLQSQWSSRPGRAKQSPGKPLRRINSATATVPSVYSPQGKPTRRATDSPNSNYRGPPSRDSIWRFLPSFLSPSQSPEASAVDLVEQERSRPRKGDVVCLGYHTLDDKGMRRLEGRSDHRPVIGSYAVYF